MFKSWVNAAAALWIALQLWAGLKTVVFWTVTAIVLWWLWANGVTPEAIMRAS